MVWTPRPGEPADLGQRLQPLTGQHLHSLVECLGRWRAAQRDAGRREVTQHGSRGQLRELSDQLVGQRRRLIMSSASAGRSTTGASSATHHRAVTFAPCAGWLPLVDDGEWRRYGQAGALQPLAAWRLHEALALWSRARLDWCREHGWPGGLDSVDLLRETVAVRRTMHAQRRADAP